MRRRRSSNFRTRRFGTLDQLLKCQHHGAQRRGREQRGVLHACFAAISATAMRTNKYHCTKHHRKNSVIVIQFIVLAAFTVALPVAAAADLGVHVVNAAGKPLSDAVVFVPAASSRSQPVTPTRKVIAQRNRVFDPFVTVLQRGDSVEFPNEDTVLHHVYSFSPAKRFEIRLYKGTPPTPVTFDTAGIVVLGCNVHDWMLAYILVVDTRFYAKTAADGVAQLAGLPAGTHALMVWYPGMREPLALQQLNLRAEGPNRVDVKLDVPIKTRPGAPPFDPMKY
jgi:plastocyanin